MFGFERYGPLLKSSMQVTMHSLFGSNVVHCVEKEPNVGYGVGEMLGEVVGYEVG